MFHVQLKIGTSVYNDVSNTLNMLSHNMFKPNIIFIPNFFSYLIMEYTKLIEY